MIDPYASPTAALSSTPGAARMPRLQPRTVWLILFGLNLPLPMTLAWLVLLPAGWPGLVAAVAMWAGVGVLVLGWFPGLIASARKGAGLVAFLQPILVVHILAGRAAVALTGQIFGVEDQLGFGKPPVLGFAGGFLATAITGAELLAVSLIVGLPIQGIVNAWRRRTADDVPDEARG